MALGAKATDIARQFIVEGLLLCSIGGVLGAVCGVLCAQGLQRFFGWAALISPLSAALAVIVAIALGVASGLYPARKAAGLDPILALNHE